VSADACAIQKIAIQDNNIRLKLFGQFNEGKVCSGDGVDFIVRVRPDQNGQILFDPENLTN
jgi:hypothetical protein